MPHSISISRSVVVVDNYIEANPTFHV